MTQTLKLVIDTDAGVDDAAAIMWLLSQSDYPVEILGFSTVAGNTTVKNATQNVLTILDLMERRKLPVVMGASKPFVEPLSRTTAMIHGPDGFWFASAQNQHDLVALKKDVPAFYREIVEAHPGATLLALGPLTNLAQAVSRYPDVMRRFGRIVALGGAKAGGTRTPVAEYNVGQDPEAAHQVLSAGLPLTLVPLDTHRAFTITKADLPEILVKGTRADRVLRKPLQTYVDVITRFGKTSMVSLPDVVAAIYAVDESLGKTQPALVKVVTEPCLARGQTIIGLTFSERITMIATDPELGTLVDQALTHPDFNFSAALEEILEREPDNVQLVTQVNHQKMLSLFKSALAST